MVAAYGCGYVAGYSWESGFEYFQRFVGRIAINDHKEIRELCLRFRKLCLYLLYELTAQYYLADLRRISDLPLIMAMHNIEYCATASPSNMADLVAKIQKGLDASKRGFAYLHVFSPCPIGWKFAPSMSIEVAKKAVASNMFPLWERENGKLTLSRNPAPITVEEFIRGIGKFKKLSSEELAAIQHMVDERYALLVRLAAE